MWVFFLIILTWLDIFITGVQYFVPRREAIGDDNEEVVAVIPEGGELWNISAKDH